MRLDDAIKDDAVMGVLPTSGDEYVSLVTEGRRATLFPVSDLNVLRGAGKGVTAIKLQEDDRVLAYQLARGEKEGLVVETNRGRSVTINARTYHSSRRGGRGTEIIRQGSIKLLPAAPVVVRREEGET